MTLKDFIKTQEGKENKAYKDANGYSIGVGHYLTRNELNTGLIAIGSGLVNWKDGLTDEQIDGLLQIDIDRTHDAIAPHISVMLNAGQNQALIDFAFNLGPTALISSTLLKKVNAGVTDETDIRKELEKWVFSQGLIIQGLVNRRKLEGDIWAGKLVLE